LDEEQEDISKTEALRRSSAFNRHADRVSDPQFAEGEFFDARDLVQVKYEMLRRVREEGASVTDAAEAFGMSRFSFYQALAAFTEKGLPGLTSKKPGPRGRHKLTPEVVAFVREELEKEPPVQMGDLPGLVREKFGLHVHRRTIERALADTQKKTRTPETDQAQKDGQPD
jgi:transposase